MHEAQFGITPSDNLGAAMRNMSALLLDFHQSLTNEGASEHLADQLVIVWANHLMNK